MPPAMAATAIMSPVCDGDPIDRCCPPRTALCGLAPALTLTPMTPEYVHKGVDAALRVDRIEWLEVAGSEKDASDNTTYFVIHVFTKHNQSRLPTTRLIHTPTLKQSLDAMARPTRTEPDYCVRRSFADLKTLYEDVMRGVQQRSHGQFCALCNDYQSYLLFTSTRLKMTFKGLLSTESQAKLVEKAILPLVLLFQGREPNAGRRDGCEAAHEIPVTLHRFLCEDEPY